MNKNKTSIISRFQQTIKPLNRLLPLKSSKVYYDSPGMLDQSSHWGSLVIWTIACGTSAALIWAFIGRVDQTVSASGTLEPISGKVDVKSPSGGIVKDLYVAEGQLVNRGDLLLRVENLGLKAQLENVTRQISLISYENLLFNLLIDGEGILPVKLPSPPLVIEQDDKVRSIQLSVQQSSSQLRQLRSRVDSEKSTLDLKLELASSMKQLYKNGSISRFNYLNAQNDVQLSRSQILQAQEQINILISQAARQVTSNTKQLLNLEARRIDLSEENRNLDIKASASGNIFNLSVSVDSVIGSGADVMRIVPKGDLKANVYLPNSDLGFVSLGQKAKLSISSFPAGEYGYLGGVVSSIGADSFSTSNSSDLPKNTYPLQITISDENKNTAFLDRLKPGMQVSALIVVRQRPVISLLTDTFTKGTEDLQNAR